MNTPENTQNKPNSAEVKKQNIDFPNLPASTEKNETEETMKKEIKETSKLHNEGKTDNTEKSSE